MEKRKLGVTLKNQNISHKSRHFQCLLKDLKIWQHWAHIPARQQLGGTENLLPQIRNSIIHHSLYSILFALLYQSLGQSLQFVFVIHTYSFIFSPLPTQHSTPTHTHPPEVITSSPDLQNMPHSFT